MTTSSGTPQTWEGRTVHFSPTLDGQTERFEEELRARQIELALGQTHSYLRESPQEFRLFQMRDAEGKAAMQAAVYVSRSRLYRGFAHANVPRMAGASTGAEEQWGLKFLRRLCAEAGDLLTLRLQPTRLEHRELLDFEARARRAGFHLVDPIDTTRTLVLDILPPPEELVTKMRKSARTRLKDKGRELLTILPITDPAFIARCREAETAARGRTHGTRSSFDFETLFQVAGRYPDRAFIAGAFLNSRVSPGLPAGSPSQPGSLMAFVVGIRHGKLAEYSAAGSFHDPELRRVPFNYFLLWELILWARSSGAAHLDLGGVTEGGPDDPLAGISEFKRYLCETEREIGREMLSVLQPARNGVFRTIQAARAKLTRAKPSRAKP